MHIFLETRGCVFQKFHFIWCRTFPGAEQEMRGGIRCFGHKEILLILHQAELSPQPAHTLRVLLCPPLSAGAAAVKFSIKALMLEKKGLEAAASLQHMWFPYPCSASPG